MPEETNEGVIGARMLTDQGKHEEALLLLSSVAKQDQTGESLALVALINFRQGNHAAAAEQYARALGFQPDNTDWIEMQKLARANDTAEINTHVPELLYFTEQDLLAPSRLPEGMLPAPLPRLGVRPIVMLRRIVGTIVGATVTAVMEAATTFVGRVAGYKDGVWTNWYRRNLVLAVLTLAYMRNQLNKHNLASPYPEGNLVAFQSKGQSPPPGVLFARTPDGSWNNLEDPKEGAAGTRFPRNVRVHAIQPETGDVLLSPNPRLVSRRLLSRDGLMKEVPFLNLLAAIWINFENHDWISHGENFTPELYEIPLAADDPARLKYRQTALFVGKTQRDPTYLAAGESVPITFINEVTHWWDGSQIYGSELATIERLRSHSHGKLRVTDQGRLPLDGKGVEDTGFQRNWWVGLSVMHTVFVKEHNSICDMLEKAHPNWDDNRLFNVARLVNAAVMAKIHSIEWTPAILPNRTLSDGLNANWYGLLTNLFQHGESKRTVAEINIRNPEMGGVVGNPINKHGQPFGLTEEFVEVYRLHSLLPERLTIRSLRNPHSIEEIPFPQARQAGSVKLIDHHSIDDLLFSFGTQHPGQLVLNNFPRFMQELTLPGNPLFDLGAVDILRARERGVPRYNEFRRQLGLNPLRKWDDLTDDADHLGRLREVYGDDADSIERLDLMVGTLAEAHRPTGFGFGETLFQIFILNATRRLQADRFYTDNFNEATYSKEGLRWIDRTDFKSVLLRHYPALASTGLSNVKNAFEPWDTDDRLDPARHPLRAFDKALRPDPWFGDAPRSPASLARNDESVP